jgi:RNA polymerase sigma factor (sigma-70 family)
MPPPDDVTVLDYAALDDAALVSWAQRGQREAFRHIMQRCNQRLFRIARSVVDDDAEAEDVVQQSYLCAFEQLATFRGDSALMTWLTRIVLNEAQGRLRVRRRRRNVDIARIESSQLDEGRVVPFPTRFGSEDPAETAAREQMRRLMEQAIDALPVAFRIVFVMREIEQCTVEETAASLGLRPETVKTRLHRARRLLRTALQDTLESALTDTFPFLGPRCRRITEAVLDLLAPRDGANDESMTSLGGAGGRRDVDPGLDDRPPPLWSPLK